MKGRRILHYEVLEELGRGGMGVVYKARDTHLERFAAIKVLPAERVADASRKARFVQEARAASALNHPNIVHIYDISSDSGVDFIAMEYVAGKTLDQLIPRKGMRLNEALKIAVQIADALARAHSAGIIHRDLKPANIMVDSHGQVKVLDFGLAKLTEQGVTSEDDSTATIGVKTDEGTIVGTAAYMSPEQAEGKPLDARSDIFSFGAVLYEMVTGHRAFQGDSKMSTLAAVLHKEPAPLALEVPHDVRRLVTRCLRKDPARRFQDIDDLKVALEELKEESDSGALLASGGGATQRRRSRLWWIATAAALLAALAGAMWLLRAQRRSAPPMRVFSFTSLAGAAWSPALSPDGEKIAFVWNGEKDNQDIYVQLVGSDRPLRLTTDPADDFCPVWSPDGRDIAFLRRTAEGLAVLRIPHLGGTERVLHRAATRSSRGIAVFGWERVATGFSWHPGGRHLALADQSNPSEPRSIYLLDLETGAKRRLTFPPEGERIGDGYPAVSPDGRHLAFLRGYGPGSQQLWLLSLGADGAPRGEPQRLIPDEATMWGMDWAADGASIIFSSNRGGTQGLWRVPLPAPGASAEPERLTVGSDKALFPSIARRGHRMAFAQGEAPLEIWRIPGPGSRIAAAPTLLIPRAFYPHFSADGKRIAYSSGASGTSEIWVCDSEGQNRIRWTHLGGPGATYPRWSPDGRKIAFTTNKADGVQHVFVMDEGGANLRQLTFGASADSFPSWSADGRSVYFASPRGERILQVWKVPAEGGEPQKVTRNGGMLAAESADGRFLYYTGAGRSGIWRVPVGGGEEVLVVPDRHTYGRWALTREGIYLIDPAEDGATEFRRFDLVTGKVTLAARLPPAPRPHIFPEVSPNGEWILYPQYNRFEFNIALVENFR